MLTIKEMPGNERAEFVRPSYPGEKHDVEVDEDGVKYRYNTELPPHHADNREFCFKFIKTMYKTLIERRNRRFFARYNINPVLDVKCFYNATDEVFVYKVSKPKHKISITEKIDAYTLKQHIDKWLLNWEL